MSNKEKLSFFTFNTFISFIIGSILRDVVEGCIGFKRNTLGNKFNSLNFAEDVLIGIICYMIVYFLLVRIRSKWAK